MTFLAIPHIPKLKKELLRNGYATSSETSEMKRKTTEDQESSSLAIKRLLVRIDSVTEKSVPGMTRFGGTKKERSKRKLYTHS